MNGLLPVQYDAGRACLLDRDTGELVAICDAPSDLLAAAHDRLAAITGGARDAKALVDTELIARMREAGERLLDTGGHAVEAKQRRDWDTDATWAALGVLVEAGLISPREAEEAMPEQTVRKPDGRKLNALLTRVVGENPAAAQALAQARSERTYLDVKATAVEGSVVA